jgi:ABC-2 type transport system ATP-binding protein
MTQDTRKIAVRVETVSKRYGDHQALDDVSLDIHDGEIFGILGPNGAGKSTLVGIIAGLRDADHGTITVLGRDVAKDAAALRELVGIQLQEAQLPDLITVEEAMRLYSSFYLNPRPWPTLLADWGLTAKQKDRYGNLSGGQKQRLFICLALLSQPKLVILDELTTGLDPQARRESWDHVERIRDDGATVIVVTHFMEEAERLCDRIAVVDHGRIQAVGTIAALTDRDSRETRVAFTAPAGWDEQILRGLATVREVVRTGDAISVMGDGFLMAEVSTALAAQNLQPADLRMDHRSLEDAFLTMTGDAIRD